MLDPFPIPPPKGLAKVVQPFADYTGLQTLPLHVHEVLLAFTLYHVTHKYISPIISRRLFSSIYTSFDARTKLNWDVHIVSLVQSCLINTLALWVIFVDEERTGMKNKYKGWEERVWGYTGASGLVQAFAGGYFVWDIIITTQYVNVFGVGMLAHAVSAVFVFSLGFRPFLNFYGPTFILYELSSPFLNIHWFCDKLHLTGSKIQLYNGIFLLTTFFSCRLIWGSYQSIRVFFDVWRAMVQGEYSGFVPLANHFDTSKVAHPSSDPVHEVLRFAGDQTVPFWLASAYLSANITLNGLNWYWFGKMIETIRKRFDPPFGTKEKKAEIETVLVEGTDVDTAVIADAIAEGVVATGVDGKAVAVSVDGDGELVIEKGIDAEGRKSLEIGQTSVRVRRKA